MHDMLVYHKIPNEKIVIEDKSVTTPTNFQCFFKMLDNANLNKLNEFYVITSEWHVWRFSCLFLSQ